MHRKLLMLFHVLNTIFWNRSNFSFFCFLLWFHFVLVFSFFLKRSEKQSWGSHTKVNRLSRRGLQGSQQSMCQRKRRNRMLYWEKDMYKLDDCVSSVFLILLLFVHCLLFCWSYSVLTNMITKFYSNNFYNKRNIRLLFLYFLWRRKDAYSSDDAKSIQTIFLYSMVKTFIL